LSDNDFYIFGESYAGKYVPWLGSTILQNNINSTSKINLQGIAIGNGWVNPFYQTVSYAPFLYRHNLISNLDLQGANALYDTYKGLIDIEAYTAATGFGNFLFDTLLLVSGVSDPYDIRKPSDPTDPLSNLLEKYLNLPQTRQKLNVGGHMWTACAFAPNYALTSDEARSAEDIIPGILKEIPVLLYNGDMDLICNMDGTSTWLSVLDWPYKAQFNSAKNVNWTIPGFGQAGYYRTASTLTQVVVTGAGHMVPYDQPRAAQDLVFRFIRGGFV